MNNLFRLIVATSLSAFFVALMSGHNVVVDFFMSTQNDIDEPIPGLKPPNPERPQPPSSSVLHTYEQAAVCSDSQECSSVGSKILQRGGTAVDAAVAALLCNGLMAMQSMGIGGGMLMNIYSHSENRAYSVLAREKTPYALSDEKLKDDNNRSQFFHSTLSIGVPNELLGYAVAHEHFGKLPWRDLVAPTVEICRKGYRLSKHQRDALEVNKIMISKDLHLRNMFFNNETKQFYRAGSHIQPPTELCESYASLAKYGARNFYKGPLSQKIVNDLRDMGSVITERDFQYAHVALKPSIVYPLGKYLLHLTPPPGSGYIVGFVMKILENFKKHFKAGRQMSAMDMHRIVEALKIGFVKRWELDQQMEDELIFNLTCPNYAKAMASLINDLHTFSDPQHYGAQLDLISRPDHGTAHLSIIDANQDAVSVTSSINFYFGTGRTGASTGILFNNALTDFSIDGLANYFGLPNVPNTNRLKPGASPMSSMSPIIVTDRKGDVRLIVGAAGGTKIISALTQILVRTLWIKENIKQAIDAARFHHQLLPDVLEYEYGLERRFVEFLEHKGHTTHRYRVRGSAVCGIERVLGKIYANADYRKDGGVTGF